MTATPAQILAKLLPAMATALVLLLAGMPLAVQAQATKQPARIGFLGTSSSERDRSRLDAFRNGLSELGYVDGQDFVLLQRYAEGKLDALPQLAAELIQAKVDVLVTEGTPAAAAAKRVTRTVPIVMGNTGDPVGTGLVVSFAKPGGNITGLSDFSVDLSAKRLELLRELAPSTTHAAVLFNPANHTNTLEVAKLRAAAELLGLKFTSFEVLAPADIERTYRTISAVRGAALVLAGDGIFGLHRDRIIALAALHRIPAIYPAGHFVDAGGLMSYSTNFDNLFRRAATYVDKILRGVKPSELPIEQPMRYQLAVNRATAKALGLVLPQSVLLRAEVVVE